MLVNNFLNAIVEGIDVINKSMKKTFSQKQIIPGNPGTSYLVCLMYVAFRKHGSNFSRRDQIEIFTRGMQNCTNNFFSSTLEEFSKKIRKSVCVYTNYEPVIKRWRQRTSSASTSYEHNQLNSADVNKLILENGYIVLSVDFHSINRLWHDYHFVCLFYENNKLMCFEPKSGKVKNIEHKKDTVIDSVVSNLRDVKIAFCA